MNLREQIISAARAGPVTCISFRTLPGVPDCCNSCHDDHEEEGYSLCSVRIPVEGKYVEASVCCTVGMWAKGILDDRDDAGRGRLLQ